MAQCHAAPFFFKFNHRLNKAFSTQQPTFIAVKLSIFFWSQSTYIVIISMILFDYMLQYIRIV